MKKTVSFFAIFCLFQTSYSQLLEDLSFGVQFGTGKTITSIDDPYGLPSAASKTDDGLTSSVGSTSGRTIRLMAHYNLSEYIALSSGFYFTNKRLWIRNDEGSYVGGSVYSTNYFHLPLLARYTSNEIADKLNMIISAGPVFDFKMSEGTEGADYAHFMNLANNYSTEYGPREKNGSNQATSLFKGTGISLFLGTGIQYRLSDSFNAYVGLSYLMPLNNMLNPNLLYNDTNLTPITETMSWKASLLQFDIGIGFSIQ